MKITTQRLREARNHGFLDENRNTAAGQSAFRSGLDQEVRAECARLAQVDPAAMPDHAESACERAAQIIDKSMSDQRRVLLDCGEAMSGGVWSRLVAWVLLMSVLVLDGTILRQVLEQTYPDMNELDILFYSFGIAIVVLPWLLHSIGRQLRLLQLATRRWQRALLVLLLLGLVVGILGTTWGLRCGHALVVPRTSEPTATQEATGQDSKQVPPLVGGAAFQLAFTMGATVALGILLGYSAPLKGVITLRARLLSGSNPSPEGSRSLTIPCTVDLDHRRRMWREQERRLKAVEALRRSCAEVLAEYRRGVAWGRAFTATDSASLSPFVTSRPKAAARKVIAVKLPVTFDSVGEPPHEAGNGRLTVGSNGHLIPFSN